MRKYNDKTNKRRRLDCRYAAGALSNLYRHGISEPVSDQEDGRNFPHPKNQVDVYSNKGKVTFVVGDSSTLVFEKDLPALIIPAGASDILL